MPADQDASKCYDPTAEEYYYGYGCTIVSTGSKIPIAAEFAESKPDPKDIEYSVEDRIKEHSEDVQLKRSTLDETYN